MVCYAVPAMAAISHYFGRKKGLFKNDERQKQLNLLLAGGAMFGIVDHWWNRELFLLKGNVASDIALGFVITFAIISLWLFIAKIGELEKFIFKLGFSRKIKIKE